MISFTPRPSQEKILAYTHGRLGISAVPGSGKTHTLSALAAQIISHGGLASEQEVLIVTLVNTAVDNFEVRIKQFFNNPLTPLYRYRIRTLHGLAHDIVREKPSRVGLEERFMIVDEGEAKRIRTDAVRAYLQSNPDFIVAFLSQDLDDHYRDQVRQNKIPELAENISLAFIRSAKNLRLTPEKIRHHLQSAPAPLPLVEMGLEIYSDYQRALQYRGAVDFDDLIRLSIDLLENDPEYLERLRYRFPYILEDEAQDSSVLQEQILSLLSGPGGNWVRVGDPNQAIFETFTTASPELLKRFIVENPHVDMPESGRSQPGIIQLANQLITWTMADHPHPEARSALTPPFIQPTPAGDPQSNPPLDFSAIQFIPKKFTPDAELAFVAESIADWLPTHSDWTLAVLVPRNTRGAQLIKALTAKGIETVEFLTTTLKTRVTAGSLNYLLAFLANPVSGDRLEKAYQVFRRDWRNQSEYDALLQQATALLHQCAFVENFLAPTPGTDFLATLPAPEAALVAELETFRQVARRWLAAVTLPVDQLVLTLAPDIFTDPSDLALAHKLALVLRQSANDHPDWRLPELTRELAQIAKNERRFIGFSPDDSGFNPELHRGKVVVTTMHKAKGLEWDRVYLLSLSNYDFPSNQPADQFISEKKFIRAGLNLEAEALAQLQALLSTSEFDWYTEGQATISARLAYVRERLRLLYVGLTRAKKDLLITYNSGRYGSSTPALGFSALQGWLESLGTPAETTSATEQEN